MKSLPHHYQASLGAILEGGGKEYLEKVLSVYNERKNGVCMHGATPLECSSESCAYRDLIQIRKELYENKKTEVVQRG